MTSRPLQKLLAIGLDSCDLEYLQRYMPHLPNLEKIFGKGTLTELDTSSTAMDASVWPTFMMGCLPGEHGYYFPFQWHAQALQYQRVINCWLPFKPFWDSLGERGCQVGVFDMPMLPLPVSFLVRRECLDHLIIFDEYHRHHNLRNYLGYYPGCRTHLSLSKAAPEGRAPESAEIGEIQACPVVGGLHHHDTRRAACRLATSI